MILVADGHWYPPGHGGAVGVVDFVVVAVVVAVVVCIVVVVAGVVGVKAIVVFASVVAYPPGVTVVFAISTRGPCVSVNES